MSLKIGRKQLIKEVPQVIAASKTLDYQNNILRFNGELTFGTVQRRFEQLSILPLAADTELVVDFSAVEKVDTSALTLCLALERRVKKNGMAIKYRHIPSELSAIAHSVGVPSLFSA